jgi:hypothetical protein
LELEGIINPVLEPDTMSKVVVESHSTPSEKYIVELIVAFVPSIVMNSKLTL